MNLANFIFLFSIHNTNMKSMFFLNRLGYMNVYFPNQSGLNCQ